MRSLKCQLRSLMTMVAVLALITWLVVPAVHAFLTRETHKHTWVDTSLRAFAFMDTDTPFWSRYRRGLLGRDPWASTSYPRGGGTTRLDETCQRAKPERFVPFEHKQTKHPWTADQLASADRLMAIQRDK